MESGPAGGKASHQTIVSLQRALDAKYRHLLEMAKADWQNLFDTPDPSDSCVTVRISNAEIVDELAAVPRAGFLPVRSKALNGKVRHRLA